MSDFLFTTRACVIWIVFLAISPLQTLAQNPPVLRVNKTDCPVEVYAACGECPDVVQSTSPVYTVAPQSVLLFSQGGNGCSGAFMYFKIMLPGGSMPIGYLGTFQIAQCAGMPFCETADELITPVDHPCLTEPVRIIGEHHPGSNAGSDCHIVITSTL